MLMKEKKRNDADAVSPVVGVMLMLVVTLIIAAVVSAYSSGMVLPYDKAPTGSFNCKIVNGGTWDNSGFTLNVLAVSEPIPTKDVKLTVSYRASDGTTDTIVTTGPARAGEEPNTHYGSKSKGEYQEYQAPLGFGPNIDWDLSGDYSVGQHYGNYSLVAGTALHASPGYGGETYGGYGSVDRYDYWWKFEHKKTGFTDAMSAIFGYNWNHLRPGDEVNVRLTHIPTGTVLFEKDVIVEG